MTTPLTGPLAAALQANRDRFNAKFAAARRAAPGLDGEVFGAHLRETLPPIVEAMAQMRPDRVDDVVEALYDLSLELLGKELIGPGNRQPAVLEGWIWLLPGLPGLLAEAPRTVAGAVSNALYNLADTPGARPQAWIEIMLQLAPHCAGVTAFLEAGKVVAWRCGLAHYRRGALEVCRSLEENLARRALGLPDDVDMAGALAQLEADLWLDPAHIGAVRRLHLAATAGAFRGFGGLFARPPVVQIENGQFIVADGQNCWLLTADVFGATFHRLDADGAESKRSSPFIGAERMRRVIELFPPAAEATSSAFDATTLALTLPLSHAVYLVALDG